MRFERVKNFLSVEECSALNAWVDLAVQNKWLDQGVGALSGGAPKRVTSRFYGNRFTYPPLVLDISRRIREWCGVSTYGLIEGHGRDGVVVSCTFPGGDVYEHRDPTPDASLAALRCNVLTRAADAGGALYLEGQDMAVVVGELHCYLASAHLHRVGQVEGENPRVLWMFGAYVPASEWNSGTIKFRGSK